MLHAGIYHPNKNFLVQPIDNNQFTNRKLTKVEIRERKNIFSEKVKMWKFPKIQNSGFLQNLNFNYM